MVCIHGNPITNTPTGSARHAELKGTELPVSDKTPRRTHPRFLECFLAFCSMHEEQRRARRIIINMHRTEIVHEIQQYRAGNTVKFLLLELA